MNVLEVKSVKKTIGGKNIIKGIDFCVKEGEIFGFLGPNGAGKTTTIRMLVGLIAPTEGEISICNKSVVKEKEKALINVGAVVENPESYKYLTGRENLMQIARIRKVSKQDIQRLIDLVGLSDRIDDKVSKYSLGMKQRLGLAAALIGDPKLLILDEPTNGLDPSGIFDFRQIVKKAAKEKQMAVFISSHILSEVQTLCDRVAFINHGEIKSVEDIKLHSITTKLESISVITKDNDKAVKILERMNDVQSAKIDNEEIKIIIDKDKDSKVLKELVLSGIEVKEFYQNRNELEQRYMELVEGGVR